MTAGLLNTDGTLQSNIVFLHIPKAGGTTVRDALRDMVPSACVYPEAPLNQGPTFASLKTDKTYLFMSHFGYKFCADANAAGITMLRHPIERLLSFYSYYKNPGRGMPLLEKSMVGDLSIVEFFKSDHRAIRMNVENSQTWQVAWGYQPRERRAFTDQDHVSVVALRNLRQLKVVGTTERLNDFFVNVARMVGAGHAISAPVTANITENRLQWSDLSAEEKSAVEACVELEWVLYDEAKRLSRVA